jgi:hypothetical protein
MAEEQIDFGQVNRMGHQAVFVRQQPSTFQVQIGPVTPGAPVGQLLMISSIDTAESTAAAVISEKIFCEAGDTVIDVLREVWPETQQILSRDAAVRVLLDSGRDHAFQYLWMERFGQPEEHLSVFNRGVMGGGLRLVLGPAVGEEHPKQLEVKVESFLAEPRQLWVETQIRWLKPIAPADMTASRLVKEAVRLSTHEVLDFINKKIEE